jgi:hypothetical protein
MAMRHFFSKLQKTHSQDFKSVVNISTVAPVIKYRQFRIGVYMHCVTCAFRDLPEINV